MSKTTTIVIRADEEQKERLVRAAEERHMTLTRFMLDAAEKAASQKPRAVSVRPAPEGLPFKGVPTFFRACVQEAQAGGSVGYDGPGWHLTNHLGTIIDADALDALTDLTDSGDLDAVVEWFLEWTPRCMELVPTRRRQQFAEGVMQAAEEGRL